MSEPNTDPGNTTAPAKHENRKPGKPTGRRKWLFRFAAMILVPVVLFGILEAGLRIGGYGKSTQFFLDGSKVEFPGVWIDNRDFGRWVFPRGLQLTPTPIPFLLKEDKKPGTYRVFVLGESAAMGFPEPSFSFARVLGVMLRGRYPDTHFEVVNVAMTAINSHIVLPIAQECADHEPDLFVVHLGNNEIVGPYGAAGVLGSSVLSRQAIRANLAVRRTRTGQLFSSLVSHLRGDDSPKVWGGMAMFSNSQIRIDDERLTRTFEHYRENLQDICRVGDKAGVPMVVCTIPVNLKDSAPFGSLHAATLSPEQTARWDAIYAEGVRLESEKKFAEAIARYQEAATIDDQFADLAFRQARCLAALGRHTEAREKYLRARDLDTLRFRSDTTINRTIREVVGERAGKGVYLADAERTFDEASSMQIPGEDLFLEHVHMNFAGNCLLARTVFQTITPILDAKLPGNRQTAMFTDQQCADRLAYTDWNELKITALVRSNMLQQAPFTGQFDREERNIRWQEKVRELRRRLDRDAFQRAINIHKEAVEAVKNDWMILMNYASILTEAGDLSSAEEQYRAVLVWFRHNYQAHASLGQIMLQTGRLDTAEFHFREALRIVPDLGEASLGLAEVFGAQGKVDEGLAIYESQLAKNPDKGTLLFAIGMYLLKAGRHEEAKRRFEESLQANPDNPMAHASLGDIAINQGRREDAFGQFAAALRLRPDWPELQSHVTQLKGEAMPPKK